MLKMQRILLACAVILGQEGMAAESSGTDNVILANTSNWRCYFVTRPPVVRLGQEIKQLGLHSYHGVWFPMDQGKDLMPGMDTPGPPTDWTAVDFDDGAWTDMPGPFFPSHHGHAYCKEVNDAGYIFFEGIPPTLATICLRGKFQVTDPSACGTMKLALAYRGGVVVYLNGQEVSRADIEPTEKTRGMEALAKDYPKEIFVKENGKVISWGFNDPQKYHAYLQKRIRRVLDLTLPATHLRKGVNVLAIEVHRAPYHESIYGRGERGAKGYDINWSTVGVTHVKFTATGSGLVANTARPANLQVWNQDTERRTKISDYGNPCEPLRPIHLIGVRNGAFSGTVVVGSRGPLRDLTATASELTGVATIPASAVQIRYGLMDREMNLPFEILSSRAPEVIDIEKGAGAVMPVWITVKVPRQAGPGDYKGTLKITVENGLAVTVPIHLHVVNWELPDPKDFCSHVGIAQSPESVALRYQVPLWSSEHWKLLEKSFELLAQVGADDIYLTALRRTHFGNEHGMIRWVRQPDGSCRPDLSIAEKYLDLAIKHLGKVPVVCLYCWEPYTGANYGGTRSKENQGMLYTILDPATGQLKEAEGPKWGTPAVRDFWRPVFHGLKEFLKKRGMEKSLMIGIAGDSRPNKDTVEDLQAVAPEVPWVVQSHMQGSNLNGQPVGYLADVWASPVAPDPARQRLHGWKAPFLRTTFPREGSSTVMAIRTGSPPVQYRIALEGMSTAGLRGFGRMGADFWNVLQPKDPLRSTYSHSLNILGRFPESNWHQLYLGNSTPSLLAPGPEGALPTVRFEMIREGVQDLEARIFLEKILLDPQLRSRLGADLADRCQQLLDDRVRALLLGRTCWLLFSGGQERRQRLYELAGSAAVKLSNK